ncbi:hypothetical protein AX016_1808 [Cellulophaga sp. RHA19]|uniref:hypothetical protein n=1 Tax=Cellulophaga sp. RHA19 TaxID=1798237 RepID=UPI000C2C3615|nr:hypothetical protein [Cellulophaga sp. RHA19]PKB43605.1 hypothetical protein AX016_1808 [Cellulophaga sp. RHA19]
MQQENQNKDNIKYLLLKTAIIGGVILFYLFQWFGPGIIQNYKQNKEFQNIHYGGDESEVNESIDNYNKAVMALRRYTDSVTSKNSSLFIYTNDTSNVEAIIKPNLNYDVFDSYDFQTVISKNTEITNELNNFLENRDSLGCKVILTTSKTNFFIKNIVNTKEETSYITYSSFYYNQKEKEQLANLINTRKNYISAFKSKEQKISELDSLQSGKIIFSETELQNKKIESGLKLIMGPRINLKDTTHLFYFTSYNTTITKKQLTSKLKNFTPLFLKKQDTTNCFIKEIPIIKPVYNDN